MAEGDADSDDARTLRPLQAAASTYRIAFCPRAGQKVLTVQGTMPRDTGLNQNLCADMEGFSLHSAVRCGAFLATRAVYELHRTGGRYALVTMCIGGGQGIATIFERL